MRSRRQFNDPAAQSSHPAADRFRRRSLARLKWPRAAGWLVLTVLASVAPGCQLNRSFFQMDSNSRVPFFGVDLAPKWPNRGSSVDGVSRLQSQAARQSEPAVEAAITESAPTRSLALPQSDAVVTTTVTDGAPVETFR
jgi:hypothetical protein